MRQLYAFDANDVNESIRRLFEDGMSTGLTNSCILCFVSRVRSKTMHSLFLHYVMKVTLHYLMLHRFEIQAPFTRPKIFGTARMKKVRVLKKLVSARIDLVV